MTRPDSGEREASTAVVCDHPDCMRLTIPGPYCHEHDAVSLPLPLAQRILAALEHAAKWNDVPRETHAVIAELRAIVERKT